ncbi:MAG: hypothetical protein ALECFALPRED_004146 [Alectoria fallacina]|uniref:alpha-1,2-Mannosidase n=1 Tax=Alectoria fallacina TaxID=1903189 RepID=A0A8H3FQJ2_9LECA|nr:MAG: hypothetical protein ALECFALPRED_004146 [Alectoria fallacina]
MFMPRRRITSLVLASILVLATWYVYSLQHIALHATKVKTRPGYRTKGKSSTSSSTSYGYNDVPSNTSEDGRPFPQDTTDPDSPEVVGPPPRFTKGQHTFGTRKFFEQNPVKDYKYFSKGLPYKLSQVQHDFDAETDEAKAIRLQRLGAVKSSFEHSWAGYKAHAWMKDELSPLDGGSVQAFGGWAATLVDTLDTLWIMGLEEEFDEAVNAAKDIDFNSTSESMLNIFETTIRYLGGFLGAYDLTGGTYPVLLQKATEVGDLLYCAFDTPNRMPVTRWKWKEALEGAQQTAGTATLIAEIGSLTLEFTRLSQLTGNLKYYDAVKRILDEFEKYQSYTSLPGLWPILMNAKTISFEDNSYTLGSMADSWYEYLPKQHMLIGGRDDEDQLKNMYDFAITTAINNVFFQPMTPDNKDILMSGAVVVDSSTRTRLSPQGQHLGCYTGGMVGIGAKIFDKPEQMNTARKLVDGCIWAYDNMPSGIMPEQFFMVPCDMNSDCQWDEKKWEAAVLGRAKGKKDGDEETRTDAQLLNHTIHEDKTPRGFTEIWDARYLLRPEAIESVFVLYRLTGDADLLDSAWRMFSNIERNTRTEFGNAMISDVRIDKSAKQNKMESFWTAETLKYFYLIFSESSVVSLDEYVL